MGTVTTSKTPVNSPCQINNHPAFRLQQARARVARDWAKDGWVAKSTEGLPSKPPSMHQNPTRSNDGTSSGALTADRLRNARRKAFDNMVKSFPIEKSATIEKKSQSTLDPPALSVKEHGVSLQMNENPIRSNDGTSSGALTADRLRQARRKVFENMKTQLPTTQIAQSKRGVSRKASLRPLRTKFKSVKEHGLGISVYQNPVRSNDGTSSGALTADRLRVARRKALESMAKPLQSSSTTSTESQPTEPSSQSETIIDARGRSNNLVKEHGLAISSYENPVRSNDGTSSGSHVADRLRVARRRALENMKNPRE